MRISPSRSGSPDGESTLIRGLPAFHASPLGGASAIDTVVLSTQHERGFPQDRLRHFVEETIIAPVLPMSLPGPRRVLINPTGVFEIGGPVAYAGLTGRKIIVDTYGGYARH